MTDKADIGWYKDEFTRIVSAVLEKVRNDHKLKSLIIRPASDAGPATRHQDDTDWEEWLKDANRDTYFTLKRLRFQANQLWASGSPDPVLRERFTTAVETEYELSIWAAREYLKQGSNGLNDLDGLNSLNASDGGSTRACRCR
jgi:hypothetical protein